MHNTHTHTHTHTCYLLYVEDGFISAKGNTHGLQKSHKKVGFQSHQKQKERLRFSDHNTQSNIYNIQSKGYFGDYGSPSSHHTCGKDSKTLRHDFWCQETGFP